jgi:hypothetical protein
MSIRVDSGRGITVPRGVPVRQHPELYDQQIERHGQRVLWYRSSKCYCLTDFARPSPTCAHCDGRGFVYSVVTSVRRVVEAIGVGNHTVILSPSYRPLSVNRVFSPADTWTVVGISGNRLVMDKIVPKHRVISVDFEDNLTDQYTGTCTVEGLGILSVATLDENEKGVYKGMIVSVQSLHNDTQNTDLVALDLWENKILVDPNTVADSDVVTATCTWVHPVKMVLSQIDPKTAIKNPNILQTYHAQVVSPGTYHIGEGDLVTAQVMRQRDSVVGIFKTGETVHKLPYFHVERILRIEHAGGIITDATLVRNNQIMWGNQKPSINAKFSVQLLYHPTFRVFDDLPNLRYAEDKEFPQRMFLKRYDLFSREVDRPSIRTGGT